MKPTSETYSELQLAYETFNAELFDGTLPDSLITLQREKATCGYFSRARFGNRAGAESDEIALNPSYFGVVPVVEVMQTLVHEMCHAWQAHHGKPGRNRYHNEEWATQMERIGLMPSDTGQPGGKRTGDKMADYPIAGGRFLRACELLLTRDFQISWYDRFPSPEAVRVGQSCYSASMDLPGPLGAPSQVSPTPSIQSLNGGEVLAVAGVRALVAMAAAAGKSNRVKYVCECREGTEGKARRPNAVWGRPGLNITCNDCGQPFLTDG
jgi:predicted SprT family Zn-dependent metalloprotease